MKKYIILSLMATCSFTAMAQEKVLNITKTDGTTAQTRVAELDEISFLTVDKGGQGLILMLTDGEQAGVLFEVNPVVTISNGKLTVKSDAADAIEIEITDIKEIVFGDATNPAGINTVKGFSCVLQDGGALLRNIPEGIQPRIYSIDGCILPTPSVTGGELHLDRATLGKGIYIVKVGSFSTKIRL